MNSHEKQNLIQVLSESRAIEYRALGKYVSETPREHPEYDQTVGIYMEDIADYTSEIDKLMEY
tara:strand:+ start:868 stop:1056 length:189 start_codon:yes stop_codon:yes gene_type:complete